MYLQVFTTCQGGVSFRRLVTRAYVVYFNQTDTGRSIEECSYILFTEFHLTTGHRGEGFYSVRIGIDRIVFPICKSPNACPLRFMG